MNLHFFARIKRLVGAFYVDKPQHSPSSRGALWFSVYIEWAKNQGEGWLAMEFHKSNIEKATRAASSQQTLPKKTVDKQWRDDFAGDFCQAYQKGTLLNLSNSEVTYDTRNLSVL